MKQPLRLNDEVWVVEYTVYYQDETTNCVSVFRNQEHSLEYINRLYDNGRGDRIEFKLYTARLMSEVGLKLSEREIPQPPLVTKMYGIVPFSPEIKG